MTYDTFKKDYPNFIKDREKIKHTTKSLDTIRIFNLDDEHLKNLYNLLVRGYTTGGVFENELFFSSLRRKTIHLEYTLRQRYPHLVKFGVSLKKAKKYEEPYNIY